jgi:predicted nucleic acid-binding protein
MYLIDANIFLEVLLGQSRGEKCKKLLRKFVEGKLEGVIPDFHIDSIVIVMENYKLGWKEIAIFLSSLFKYKGLRIWPMDLTSKIIATSHMKGYGLDFDDALAYECMIENKIKEIISYDYHFDKLKNIDRITPEKLMQ